MSMNLRVKLVGAGQTFEPGGLCQTPTTVTYAILEHKRWQDQARAYLTWYENIYAMDLRSKSMAAKAYARECIKAERQKIGKLWRLAEEGGGRLEFFAA